MGKLIDFGLHHSDIVPLLEVSEVSLLLFDGWSSALAEVNVVQDIVEIIVAGGRV
jgi:hypothetical protein